MDMKYLPLCLLLTLPVSAMESEPFPCPDCKPAPGVEMPAIDLAKVKNFVKIPTACRVVNVDSPTGGCCGWASLETLLLEAGYDQYKGMTARERKGGVTDN